MRKTKLVSTAMLALAFVLAIGFSGCTKDDVVTPDGGPQNMIGVDYNSTDNYITATYDAQQEFVPATIETEMEYVDAMGNGKMPPMPPKCLFLGDIFKRMRVTPEQMREFKLFIAVFEKCSKEAQTLTPEQVRELIKGANVRVKEIIALVRKGDLTREEAKAKIEIINKKLRETLDASVDKEARCNCLRELFRKISGKLTDAQKVLWDAWVAKLQNPCLGVSQ